ncbi:WSC domain-containing protein [Cladobotryum mycophilum]|uniref:WSC domain-containing protein n=1 Tax=Cladobotryum mycophilum TaxID=491253 RepID=A0ABR0SVD1_9HYPO
MKNALLSLAVLALGLRFCAASPYPEMQYDPDTTKDCLYWYNNIEGKTCQQVRDYFNLTPEEFAQWNPSVGVNCDKLWIVGSYCIMTNEKLAKLTATASPSEATSTSTTTTSTTLGPSPTAWKELGCYADRLNRSILDKLVSGKDGDAALTIPKCQDTCYRLDFQYAGVKAGNECWCSGYVAGEWTPHTTDCNMTCTGDIKKNCGGKDCLNVFKALKPEVVPPRTTTTSTTTATGVGKVAQTSRPSSGAVRNLGLFRWL